MTKTEEALNKLVEMREDDIIAKTLLLCRSYAIREGSDYGVSIAEEAIIEYANTRTPESGDVGCGMRVAGWARDVLVDIL